MRLYDYQKVTYVDGEDKLLGSRGVTARNFTINLLSSYVSDRVKNDLATNPINVVGNINYNKISAVPVASNGTNGILTSADYSTIMSYINRPIKLDLITSATNTIIQNKNDIQILNNDFNYLYLYCQSPPSGNYSAEVSFYTLEGSNLVEIAATTLTKDSNVDYVQIFTEYNDWCACVNVNGIVPSPGISVKVMI